MSTPFNRNTPEAIALLKRREKAVGFVGTCSDCGRESRCAVDTRHILPTVMGERTYGRCGDCACLRRRSGGEFERAVVASLLGVDFDNIALNGVRVERFADRASARPDRPNNDPWQHVDHEALAAAYRANEDHLVCMTGDPCAWCGTTLCTGPRFGQVSFQTFHGDLTVREQIGGGWRDLRGLRDVPAEARGGHQCVSCSTWFNDRWGGAGSADRRSLAASALSGLVRVSDPMMRVPYVGFGAATGLQFFFETRLKEGATYPWAHVSLRSLRESAQVALRRYSPSVAQEFAIDLDLHGTVTW